MIHRPFPITVIGALLISSGILSCWGIVSTARIVTEVSGWSQMFSHKGALFAVLVASSAVEIIAGINILLGKNWARVLWTCWYILDLGLKFFLSIETPLSFQIVQLAFIFFLFRAEANSFFEAD